MPDHRIATREEWLQERLALLEEEKAQTRRDDALAAKRQALPWVRIERDYRFDTERGPVTLADLFDGRSQLIVYHFMYGPDYSGGCASCSAIADGFDGIVTHLRNHDVAFTAVSRAPLATLLAYRERMGWTFPWASSADSEFNFDFDASFTEDDQRRGIRFNYADEPGIDPDAAGASGGWDESTLRSAAATGTDVAVYSRERPGMSSFVIQDGAVYHCYSSYSRGMDAVWLAYRWFDRAPLGRNESQYWWKRHDEYPAY